MTKQAKQNKQIILAIDSASNYLSLGIAIAKQDGCYHYDHWFKEIDCRHCDYILVAIKELLQANAVNLQDITMIAYNQGPGSFTGLRIGLGIAKGIGYGLDIPLLAIDSFSIFAAAAKKHVASRNILFIGLDARLNEIYLAGYINGNRVLNPCIAKPQDILHQVQVIATNYCSQQELAASNATKNSDSCNKKDENGNINAIFDNIALIGSGFDIYHQLLPQTLQNMYINIAYPNTQAMLDLAISKQQLFTLSKAAHADLFYLRDKVALNTKEQKEQKEHKEQTTAQNRSFIV